MSRTPAHLLAPILRPWLAGLLVALGAAAPASAEKPLSYTRDIRPILADKCFQCHGADPKKRKADLRLDIPEGATAKTPSGNQAIVPGKLDESELYWRIRSEDDEDRMPPKSSGKSLTPAEVATLMSWVEQGARYERHWAFSAPTRPTIPAVHDRSWVQNPIDAFVLARLDEEGLKPSPRADKITLLRRLSLDLTGLPPTIEEVDAFLADQSPEAYRKQVDRLLDSPHYGERWARIWLDAARYADSDGYEKDKSRQVWFYRDWVIRSLNRDLPYDQFVVEQLAGDLLPNAGQDQVVATGFLRNSMINEEGGIDPEQFRMEAMFDRMEAIGKGMLGLTIQCAQCHSHKYDPLTHDEYYKMFAFLNESHEANVAVYTPDEQRRRADIFRRISELEADLKHRHPDWPERMAEWEKAVTTGQPQWTVVRPDVDDISTGGQKYYLQDDGSFLAQGYAPTKHRVKLTAKVDAKDITGVRLELLTDPNLPLGGPGRSIEGTAALTEFEVHAAPADHPGKDQRIKIVEASADFNPPETPLKPYYDDRSKNKRVTGPIGFAVDGKDETAWGTDAGPGRRNQPRKAVFRFDKPVGFPKGTVLTFYLQQNHGGWNSDDNQTHNLGRFRLSVTAASEPSADPLPKAVRDVLSVPAEQRSPAQVAAVFSYWRTSQTDGHWAEANAQIEALWKTHPEGSSQLVVREREKRRGTHVLQRGDFLKPGKFVEPGVPAFLNPLPPSEHLDRLAFARWLVDPKAPTTARALVNRVWQAYFGTGLVSTSEDLGTQAEFPSHAQLLDWLSVEFVETGWKLKDLHRRIVLSETYRQSSKVTAELLTRDPYNRLLARGPRFRVDAELVRDIALAASGLLNPEVGGPSVFPPAPDFLFQPPVSYGPKIWKEEKGPERYRRALYTFRYRSVPYPMLQTFDAPNGDFSCVRRARSNTPLQALTTLNENVFMECSRALALRTLEHGGSTDPERVAYAFRRYVSRPPSESEAKVLLDLYQSQLTRMEQGQANPRELAALSPDEKGKLPGDATPAQAAAWTAVARVILNLDETITKE